MPRVARLDSTFGVEICGLDLAAGIDAAQMKELTGLLYQHQVIVLRDQLLDQDQYLAFGRQWGQPIPHVLDHMRMAGYPELMTVGNTEERDKKPLIRNGAALWHTDQSYEKIPASATMLYSIQAPRVGGETQFCNMVAAYNDLDEATKLQTDALRMAHKYGMGRRHSSELDVNPLINEDQDDRVPVVYHNLVRPHPVTGIKALYALGHGAHGIQGMETAAALDFIDALKAHALQEKYIYRHPYTVGDVVVWDTMATMHSATPIDIPSSQDEARLLWRISVRGAPLVHASELSSQ